jgi:mono/diheme cytochrome c family protein
MSAMFGSYFNKFVLGVLGISLLAIGCDAPIARFRMNMALVRKTERAVLKDGKKFDKLSSTQLQDIANIMTALFGTPDEPKMPVLDEVSFQGAIDPKLLQMAAGPVASDEVGNPLGLYREHCVHCHGITGDGAGPTAAFLNPYPRDYRQGLFKFKSSKKGMKPTHEDLTLVLKEGIAGTAMPSFKLLSQQEIESLIHYVRYLSIRGEAERKLIDFAANEKSSAFDKDPKQRNQPLYTADPQKSPEEAKQQLQEIMGEEGINLKSIVQSWLEPVATAVPSPTALVEGKQMPVNLDFTNQESIERGKKLFYGPIANCFSCHGDSGLGDGQKDFYDDWSQQWVEKGDENGSIRSEYVALGALEPRFLIPRNLRLGVYRGGHRPIDLYWRIVNGIDGAQMPAAKMKADDAPKEDLALTNADVWDIINYVRSLPYESISHPALPQSNVQKESL